MTPALAAALIVTAVGGTAVVTCRDPRRQTLLLAGFSLVLAVLFLLLQAPSVALSQIAVGSALVPTMVMLVLAKAKGDSQ